LLQPESLEAVSIDFVSKYCAVVILLHGKHAKLKYLQNFIALLSTILTIFCVKSKAFIHFQTAVLFQL